MPIERAVPSMILMAASMSLALRSAILVSAISRTWALDRLATLVFCGTAEPFSTPAALRISRAAGGGLVMKVNDRSSYTEISTGTMSPRWASVAALYCLQNSMMLTPCWPSAGPTGGAGVACPAWICSLMRPATFFFGGMSGSSDLRNLAERQLDRCLPAEDGHEDLQPLALGVDLVDGGGQRGEWAVHDGDRLADLEVDNLRSLGLLGFLGLRREELHHVVERQRRRVRGADEACDARGVLHSRPGLVGEVHAHQHVAGEDLRLHDLALALLDLRLFLRGDLDLEDEVLHVERRDPRLEVGLHLVLVTGIGVYDVPVAGQGAQPFAEGFDRVGVLFRLGRVGLGGVRRRRLGLSLDELLLGHRAADRVELHRLLGRRLVRGGVAGLGRLVRLQIARRRLLRAAERVVLLDGVRA